MSGFTTEEAFLHSLAKKSFLKFWSWPNLFRNQGNATNSGDGKEICDLVVVFGNDIILFSDKKIEFNDKKDISISWPRWSKSAIKESVDQLRGARRRIQTFPDRIFLNKLCNENLPLDLPPANEMRFHSIVVCHGIEEQLIKVHGESSFIFDNSIIDADHWAPNTSKPYAIGKITNCGFVHVFNGGTIDLILREFDTVKDFLSYLEQREKLISHQNHIVINSESDIVHLYYQNMDDYQKRSILVAQELRSKSIHINKGGIQKLYGNPEYRAKKLADKISYFWDDLIESFTYHILNGSSEFCNHETPNEIEPSLRVAAATSRFERRILSENFHRFYEKAVPGQRGTRLAFDPFDTKKAYLFFLLPYVSDFGSYEEYREARRGMLQDYCLINKLLKPHIEVFVGIAAQTRKGDIPLTKGFFQEGQDFTLVDTTGWDDESVAHAKVIYEEYIEEGLFAERKFFYEKRSEFPEITAGEVVYTEKINLKGRDRNTPCICGSGKKLKKCCGG